MRLESRTKNATKNVINGALVQCFSIVINFIVRTIFIKKLGLEYLGVNGLFTNILTILSFAELGIGNAIIYNMYSAVATENKDKINSLMKLYKKSYNIIGLIVLLTGGVVTFFIKDIIKDIPNIQENIYIIYILFLLNTGMSYFFTYKKSIILAHQKLYIVNMCKLIAEILKLIIQTFILLFKQNFILYLIVQILMTVLENIASSIIANKLYPYLKEKKVKSLTKNEKNKIFQNVKSLILYKFGSVVLNGTDNIIISKMFGLEQVGLLSNFNMIINTLTNILGNALNGFTASIGNLNTYNDSQKQEKIFKLLFLLCVWIYGVCSIAFIVLANPFVEIWVGNEFCIPLSIIIAMALHLYITGVQFAGFTYRTTLGLFNKGKYAPMIATIINVLLSIILGKHFGITGVLVATSIARILTTTWQDIYLVYKYCFKKSSARFFINYILCFISVFFIGVLSYLIIDCIKITSILGFIIKVILVIIIPNIMLFIMFFKTEEFKELYKKAKEVIWKKKTI